MSYAFGSGLDPWGLTFPKWALVNSTPVGDTGAIAAQTLEHAVGIDGNGEYLDVTERTFNAMTEIASEYIANTNDTAYNIVTDVWAIARALIGTATAKQITEIVIRTTNSGDQRARLSIRGHTHDANLLHQANSHLPTMDLASDFDGYGASDFIGTSFDPSEIISSDLTFRIGHVDKQGADGNWLVGRSQGIMVEAKVQAISDIVPAIGDSNPVVIGAPQWTLDSMIRGRPGGDFGVWNLAAHIFYSTTP